LLHADELEKSGDRNGKVRIESFVVGRNVEKGERLQWVVEGGKYKASFLLDVKSEEGSRVDCAECGGLLISEVRLLFSYFFLECFRPFDRATMASTLCGKC